MQAAQVAEFVTAEDYLADEPHNEVRHEYLGGVVFALAGASDEHVALRMNLTFALRSHLRGRPCRVLIADAKVRLQLAGEDVFYYPDVMVACDPRDTDRYFKRFPKVPIEVLSETTETIERRENFSGYRQIETLEEYVLVAQDKMEVTIIRRAHHWQPEVVRQPERELRLASLDFRLPLDAVSDGVAL